MTTVLQDLNFDTFQRFNIIRILMTLLPDFPDLSVLDVGGFPGTLSDCVPEVGDFITVDTHVCKRKGYVRASGASLPFGDDSFDVVISSDTLEHIPQGQREDFINELMRVCKTNLIIACPFHTKENEFAEQSIMKFYERVRSAPYSWLEEHRVNSLPELDSVISHFTAKGMFYKVFPNGNIVTWYIMEALQIILDSMPGTFDLFKICNASYNKFWSREDNREPAYRKVFITSFDKDNFNVFLHNLKELYPQFDYKILIDDNAPIDELSLSQLHDMSEFFNQLLDKISDVYKEPETGGGKILSQYVTQLERILNDEERVFKRQQKEIQTLANKLESIQSRKIFRILSKLGVFPH